MRNSGGLSENTNFTPLPSIRNDRSLACWQDFVANCGRPWHNNRCVWFRVWVGCSYRDGMSLFSARPHERIDQISEMDDPLQRICHPRHLRVRIPEKSLSHLESRVVTRINIEDPERTLNPGIQVPGDKATVFPELKLYKANRIRYPTMECFGPALVPEAQAEGNLNSPSYSPAFMQASALTRTIESVFVLGFVRCPISWHQYDGCVYLWEG